MNDRSLRRAAATLASAGAAVMAYLLVERYRGGAPVCAGGGCATVQSSRYAEIFGLPVSALGLAGFVAIIVASAIPGPRAWSAQAFVVFGAIGFSAYLVVIQLFVIDAVCEWCLAGDVLLTGVAAVVLLRLRLRVTV